MKPRVLDYDPIFGQNLKLTITPIAQNVRAYLGGPNASYSYKLDVTYNDEAKGPQRRTTIFDSLNALFEHIHDNFD